MKSNITIRYRIQLDLDEIQNKNIIEFYDYIAFQLGKNTDNVKYDCRKIDVSKSIQDSIFKAIENEIIEKTPDVSKSDISLTLGMMWCNIGPKCNAEFPDGFIEITDDFFVYDSEKYSESPKE